MKIPESWGHHADALVACVMGGFALSLTIVGLFVTCRNSEIMPFAIIFLLATSGWWAWIGLNLWQRWHMGHYHHAAWHVVVALPLSTLSIFSTLCVSPSKTVALPSAWGSERLFQQILHSVLWWWQQT
ncbi:MAG: hypothetical protein ACOVRB_03945 [Akkermansiaceae bacterium]|jgi:hypothetical protein